MRIALLTDIYKPSANGVVHHVAMLKQCLESWGETVYLFVPSSKMYKDDEPNVIRIPGIPLADTGYHLSLGLDRRSRKLLSNMDILHVHHPFVSGSFGLYCANRYGIPLVFTNHTRYDLYVKQYLRLLPAVVSETALQTYFHSFSQRCSALVAPSESVAEIMRSWGVQGKVVVIPNGVDVKRFANPTARLTKADLGLPDDAVVALYVGRMSGEKSLDRLLRLFRYVADEYPPVHLVLVGEGPELEALQALAAELGLQTRVRFTGGVRYEEVPAYMAVGDFFVSTSLSEVHPLTFIEAAAAGLPALGIRSPGIADIIVDGVTGLIAENNDLSFGLRFLRLAQDPALRQCMRQAAVERSRTLSVENNARRLLELYHELTQH
ncbi:MAG TPA: glycosyltransferase [Caldilineaceae bacterium]|nr:glycosyltransferase [Caldilineaceae bacterium]